ncbi:MAG TPA: ChbG/HpnK family deacetylase [Pirellulaceae bacterium]
MMRIKSRPPRSPRLYVVLFLAIGLLTGNVSAQTTAEKLGYATGTRVLILHATEAGICWESNQAVQQLLAGDLVKSASVVATGPWADVFVEWARRRPELDFGVSLALHNPYPSCQWRFATPATLIPSLVDARGFPCASAMQMAMNANAEDAEREFLEQLRVARDAGLRITHLVSLDGSAFSRTDLASVLSTISRQQWIPAPVVELTPEIIARFRERGLELDQELEHLVSHYPLPKLDNIEFIPRGESYSEKRDAFGKMLSQLRPGLVQVNCSPLVESEGIKRLDPDWQQRVWELKLMTDPAVIQTMKEARIEFSNWREVMGRFESRSASQAPAAKTSTP